MPRAASISHVRLRLSVKRTISPGSAPLRAFCRFAFAQVTCREPGPWHASQETSISEYVVTNRSAGQV